MTDTHFVDRILQELGRCSGNLTASQAAQLAQRSQSRMRHVFTANAGMTFRTARLHARIKSAVHLLTQTDMSIPRISAQLGYSDRSKFEKAFKRIYHLTPTQFRRGVAG